jgi:hypothetical protein
LTAELYKVNLNGNKLYLKAADMYAGENFSQTEIPDEHDSETIFIHSSLSRFPKNGYL